jgi:DNA-binding XRE family transcriptional regulator
MEPKYDKPDPPYDRPQPPESDLAYMARQVRERNAMISKHGTAVAKEASARVNAIFERMVENGQIERSPLRRTEPQAKLHPDTRKYIPQEARFMEEVKDWMTVGSLARQVRRLRMQAQMSQKELSKRAGVSVKTIINIEQGKTNPNLDVLSRIADVFGYEVMLSAKLESI